LTAIATDEGKRGEKEEYERYDMVQNLGESLLEALNLSKMKNFLFGSLFPSPSTVTDNYWQWIRWRLLHRFFSSGLAVFGTQVDRLNY